jgi:hypothetical protein
VPAIQPYIIEPIFEQFCALLPDREVDHPLGCHRPRIPDLVHTQRGLCVMGYSSFHETSNICP